MIEEVVFFLNICTALLRFLPVATGTSWISWNVANFVWGLEIYNLNPTHSASTPPKKKTLTTKKTSYFPLYIGRLTGIVTPKIPETTNVFALLTWHLAFSWFGYVGGFFLHQIHKTLRSEPPSASLGHACNSQSIQPRETTRGTK